MFKFNCLLFTVLIPILTIPSSHFPFYHPHQHSFCLIVQKQHYQFKKCITAIIKCIVYISTNISQTCHFFLNHQRMNKGVSTALHLCSSAHNIMKNKALGKTLRQVFENATQSIQKVSQMYQSKLLN